MNFSKLFNKSLSLRSEMVLDKVDRKYHATILLENIMPGLFGNTIGSNRPIDFSGAASVALPGATTVAGAQTITSTSANAFAVGANGSTNPAFNVDASTASQAAGLNVKGAATGGTVAVATIDSGSNTSLTIDGKGTGTVGINTVSTTSGLITLGNSTSKAGVTVNGNLTINAANIVTDTTTGMMIGTANTQKLGFFGATPVVQPQSPSGNTHTVTAGSTTNVFVNTTFDGGSGSTAYTVGDLVLKFKNLGLLAF